MKAMSFWGLYIILRHSQVIISHSAAIQLLRCFFFFCFFFFSRGWVLGADILSSKKADKNGWSKSVGSAGHSCYRYLTSSIPMRFLGWSRVILDKHGHERSCMCATPTLWKGLSLSGIDQNGRLLSKQPHTSPENLSCAYYVTKQTSH